MCFCPLCELRHVKIDAILKGILKSVSYSTCFLASEDIFSALGFLYCTSLCEISDRWSVSLYQMYVQGMEKVFVLSTYLIVSMFFLNVFSTSAPIKS